MKMKPFSGNEDAPIWLLGDSNPVTWERYLKAPLESRHPARHNIWSSVLVNIQKYLYTETGRLLDEDMFYVRNAIENSKRKPGAVKAKGTKDSWAKLELKIRALGKSINKNNPQLIITFGAFSYEFVRRAMGIGKERSHTYWKTDKLGADFDSAIKMPINKLKNSNTRLVPLLHVSISRGKFLESHATPRKIRINLQIG